MTTSNEFAKWSLLSDQMREEPPDYSGLFIHLSNLKDLLKSLYNNDKSSRKVIDDRIDLDLLKQMISNMAFDGNDLSELISFCIATLAFVSPSEVHPRLRAFNDNMDQMIADCVPYNKLIPHFLEDINKFIKELSPVIRLSQALQVKGLAQQ